MRKSHWQEYKPLHLFGQVNVIKKQEVDCIFSILYALGNASLWHAHYKSCRMNDVHRGYQSTDVTSSTHFWSNTNPRIRWNIRTSLQCISRGCEYWIVKRNGLIASELAHSSFKLCFFWVTWSLLFERTQNNTANVPQFLCGRLTVLSDKCTRTALEVLNSRVGSTNSPNL